MLPPGYQWVPSKNFSPFGPAVCLAIGNIYTNVFFYYMDTLLFLEQYWLTELTEVSGEIFEYST